MPRGAVVLSTQAPSNAIAGLVHLPVPTPEGVARALSGVRQPIRHVRLLTEMPPRALPAVDTPSDLALHDLLFLTIQQCYERTIRTRRHPGRVPARRLGRRCPASLRGPVDRPGEKHVGRAAPLLAYTVLTTSRNAAEGVAQVTRESGAKHFLPVVVYEEGVRKTSFLEPVEPDIDANAAAWLGPDSVMLAAGGSRGIAAELLLDVARRYRPTIYVLGRSDIATEQAAISSRAEYVRLQLQNRPGTSVADLSREYQQLVDAQATRSNLDRMAEHCGAGRVRYLRCDLSDEQTVQKSRGHGADARRVVSTSCSTSRASTGPLTSQAKRFEDFRAVRDVKVHAYRNLVGALGDNVGTWCNFGSIIGFTGQAGETDYAAANDFLITAAQAAATHGRTRTHHRLVPVAGRGTRRRPGQAIVPREEWHLHRDVLGRGRPSLPAGDPWQPNRPGDRAARRLRVAGCSKTIGPDTSQQGRRRHPSATTRSRSHAEIPTVSCWIGELAARRRRPCTSAASTWTETATLQNTWFSATPPCRGHSSPRSRPRLPWIWWGDECRWRSKTSPCRRSFAIYDRGRPVHKRITAQLLHHDEQSSRVRVRILGDVVAPTGQVLVRDRQHFQLDVLLQDRMPHAPRWERWSELEDGAGRTGPIPHGEPCSIAHRQAGIHNAHPSARTRSTGDIRPARATRRPHVLAVPGACHPARWVAASLGARPGARRSPDTGGPDVHPQDRPVHDRQRPGLSLAYPVIDLYSCPRRLDLEGTAVANRCVAASPDGTMLAQVHDTATAIVGYIHIETGRFATREQMAAGVAEAVLP